MILFFNIVAWVFLAFGVIGILSLFSFLGKDIPNYHIIEALGLMFVSQIWLVSAAFFYLGRT